MTARGPVHDYETLEYRLAEIERRLLMLEESVRLARDGVIERVRDRRLDHLDMRIARLEGDDVLT